MSEINLYSPTDCVAANAAWGAACGPCSLAAVLRCQVADVRRLVPEINRRRQWINPTGIKAALDRSGVAWKPGRAGSFPIYGLAFVQFCGPWDGDWREEYLHTHWVGAASVAQPVQDGAIYDCNADGWIMREDWEGDLIKALTESSGGDGRWKIRLSIEVARDAKYRPPAPESPLFAAACEGGAA